MTPEEMNNDVPYIEKRTPQQMIKDYDEKGIQPNEPIGRQFESGAYRDTDEGKLDYEAFLSPVVLKSYAEYMHKNRKQTNGELRDGDNWQKGIDKSVYMKSMYRHFFAVWEEHRGVPTEDGKISNLNALLFNVMGYLFEEIRDKKKLEAQLRIFPRQPIARHIFNPEENDLLKE